jgi:hypothetical protein
MEHKVRKFEQRRVYELLFSTTLIYMALKKNIIIKYLTILFEFLEQWFSTF